MHESALARQILSVVLERAAAVPGRIRRVRGWIAETESLAAESLAFHFAAHARGTDAEGAELELRLLHVDARCRHCAKTFAPEHHLLVCPDCGSQEADLLGQTGIGIETLEIE